MPSRSLPNARPFVVAAFVACVVAPAVRAEEVVLRIRDQHGAELPGAFALVDGNSSTTYATGSTVTLAPGPHSFALYPPIAGIAQGTSLLRYETATIAPGQVALDFEWITASLTIHVRDQFGADIPGSAVAHDSVLSFQPTPFTAVLPITDRAVYPTLAGGAAEGAQEGYDFQIAPGVLGGSPGYALWRRVGRPGPFDPVEVHAGTSELSFEWITATLVVDLVDQAGASWPNGSFRFSAFTTALTPVPATVTLPITDPAVYPLIDGNQSDLGHGYDTGLVPSLAGVSTAAILGRDEGLTASSPVAVHAGQTELTFEWIAADVVLDVVDGEGASLPGSRIAFDATLAPTAAPLALRMPITDPDVYPSLFGGANEPQQWGYDIQVLPGLDGHLGSYELWRSVGNPLSGERIAVHADTTRLEFEWLQVVCPLALLDSSGVLVAGSAITLPSQFGSPAPGDEIRFPITDNGAYPTLSGAFANGYPIAISPGDAGGATATFEFEVAADHSFTPEHFTIAGDEYRLDCGDNQPPLADAGDNVVILSSAQAATTIAGSGSDPDGQALTYQWLDGALPLFGPAAVGAGGEAPLDLGGVAALAVGDHVLTLAVSDGELTATATMTLTISNSPPTASATGAGTYQAGHDVVLLTGTVADFDGESLAWEWRDGATLLASGSVVAPLGGAPVALPPTALPAGIGGLALGLHTVTLSVQDSSGVPVVRALEVRVVDSLAPTLAPVIDCGILWPPNHRMVMVTIVANAVDAAGGPVLLSASAVSSEDPDKDGDGHTIPDIVGPAIDQATGTIVFELRAERAGKGRGRVYTITIVATDASGNTSTATVTCIAPHDRRK